MAEQGSSSDIIVILEDAHARIEAFEAAISSASDLALRVQQYSTAESAIAALRSALPNVALISLDHDLYCQGPEDPGDGVDVARWLASQEPCCSVIVHSSNRDRVQVMIGELELGGWNVHRILPYGEHWVDREWLELVRTLIAK